MPKIKEEIGFFFSFSPTLSLEKNICEPKKIKSILTTIIVVLVNFVQIPGFFFENLGHQKLLGHQANFSHCQLLLRWLQT